MLGKIIEFFPYSFALFLTIIVPAVLIAKQEAAIEGPFGWSSLTFTKRYKPNHWISKFYRTMVGKDKWATEYHLLSNGIWILLYAIPIVFVLIGFKLAGAVNTQAFWETFTLGFVSLLMLVTVEDYIWFVLHPYYGPERHNANYVPWFQNFKAGIPVVYWISMIATYVIVFDVSLAINNYDILIIWVMGSALVLGFSFFILPIWSKKIERLPLAPFWWKKVKIVALLRCPYANEELRPMGKSSAYSIPVEVFRKLVRTGEIQELDQALEK